MQVDELTEKGRDKPTEFPEIVDDHVLFGRDFRSIKRVLRLQSLSPTLIDLSIKLEPTRVSSSRSRSIGSYPSRPYRVERGTPESSKLSSRTRTGEPLGPPEIFSITFEHS